MTPVVLDVEGGIARLMGNSAIYFNALQRFSTHIEAARAVAGQLAAGDHANASRTIHTLQGAAGLLGAGEVQAIAGNVEAALAHGEPVAALLDELEAALQRVQARIGEAAATNAAITPTALVLPTAIASLPDLLDRVCALLDEGNATAIDMLDKYGAVLEKALGAAAWNTITAAAQDYDFDCALAALQSARPATMR